MVAKITENGIEGRHVDKHDKEDDKEDELKANVDLKKILQQENKSSQKGDKLSHHKNNI